MRPSALRKCCVILTAVCVAAPAQQTGGTAYPIFDPAYAYAASRHLGEARFGTVGVVNKRPEASLAVLEPACSGAGRQMRCPARFRCAFGASDPEEFCGVFVTLGRIAIDTVNPDGSAGRPIDLHKDGTFNLRDLALNAADDLTSIESLRLVLRPKVLAPPLTLRVELEDANSQKMFRRVVLDTSASTDSVVLTLPLSGFTGAIDRTAVKLVAVVIEELHVVDGVRNPQAGEFVIDSIALVDQDGPRFDRVALSALDDKALVAAIARRDFEALLRLADARSGASLDRTLFRDLLHWGATGWLLASLPGAVKQGWLTSGEAERIGLTILRFVDNDALWCDRPAGCIGNSRGVMYRFGGIDPGGLLGPATGTRKIDLGAVNNVEASVIDTALFQFGAATCAAGFPANREFQTRVRSILNRTRWTELIDPETKQVIMAWKPQRDETAPGFFTKPAPFGGFWASRDPEGKSALTIDHWTDEGGLVAILAAGSETYPVGAEPWYRMLRKSGAGPCAGLVVSYPGAWFTYTFLTATYLDDTLGPDRGADWGVVPVDWRRNASGIFEALRSLSPAGDLVLPDAVELPDTTYLAQGLPACAADPAPKFTGTRSPYSLQLALGLGGETAARAVAQLRKILTDVPDVWDPLVGLLDSYHPDLASFPATTTLVRSQGLWIQQQVWPLNKGAALIAQLNYLDDGVVRRTANQHEVIKRGIDKIYRRPVFTAPGLVNSASFRNGSVAPDSWVDLYGENLGSAFLLDARLPLEIGDVGVALTDSRGALHQARLHFVDTGRIQFLTPPRMAMGPAMLSVTNATGGRASAPVEVAVVAPGVFSANASGQGPAAASYICVKPDRSRDEGFTFTLDPPPGRRNVPLDVAACAEMYLSFYGTGFRGQTSARCRIGALEVPVLAAVAQGQFEGLDQAVVGPLPLALKGRGEVSAEFTFNGAGANTVTVNIR